NEVDPAHVDDDICLGICQLLEGQIDFPGTGNIEPADQRDPLAEVAEIRNGDFHCTVSRQDLMAAVIRQTQSWGRPCYHPLVDETCSAARAAGLVRGGEGDLVPSAGRRFG